MAGPAPEASWFENGRLGRYEILAKLAAGGMGTVFKARHVRMKRIVALKLLLHSLAQDTHFVQRFQREVCASNSMINPSARVFALLWAFAQPSIAEDALGGT